MSNYADCIIHLLSGSQVSDNILSKRFMTGNDLLGDRHERSFSWLEGPARIMVMVANWVDLDAVHEWFGALPWEDHDQAVLSTTDDYSTQISTVVDGRVLQHRAMNV